MKEFESNQKKCFCQFLLISLCLITSLIKGGRGGSIRENYMSMQKHFKLNFLLPLFAAAILFSGCTSEKYRDLTYGGSFLIDSLTVGIIRTVNIERVSSHAWDGGDYIDGKQDLLIYSVPERKVTKTIRIASGSEASLMGDAMAVTYS